MLGEYIIITYIAFSIGVCFITIGMIIGAFIRDVKLKAQKEMKNDAL